MGKLMDSNIWFSILLACSAKQVSIQSTQQPAVETVIDRALYAQLQDQLDEWSSQEKPDTITPAREEIMNDLVSWIREKQQKNETSALIFVCTHNSRRSHIFGYGHKLQQNT